MATQIELLSSRRFLPLFVTQFLGALNDNVIKNSILVLLAFNLSAWTTLPLALLANLAAGLFMLPFFLFSATAGQLADKYDKAKLSRIVKIIETAIVVVVSLGFWQQSLPLLLFSLFLLGAHSTLFGPIKYAILPQHLSEKELIGGNGLIEAGTFVAILLGTVLGGFFSALPEAKVIICSAALFIAVAGYLASRSIPSAPSLQADLILDYNIVRQTINTIQVAKQNRAIFLSILGISWFWLYGSLLLTQFPAFTQDVLHGDQSVLTLLLAIFTIGIGIGSMTCEKLSDQKIELGLVPLGAIGLTISGFDFAFAHQATSSAIITQINFQQFLSLSYSKRLIFDLVAIGFFGGLFIVPLYALIQQRAAKEMRARIIAANNIVNAAFMVGGAIVAAILLHFKLSIPSLFALAAVANALVAIYIFRLLPEFLMRFIFWLLVHSIYRLRSQGIDNIPKDGAALLIANHVSFVDALIIAAASPRPIRFIMDHQIFKWPVLSFVFRHGKAIPIAPARENEALMKQAFQTAAEALADGDLVAIFPEGKLTADGKINNFRPGYQQILHKLATPVPIIPMSLDGLWGSIFSRYSGKFFVRLRRNVFKQIDLNIGCPITSATVSPEQLQEIVLQLKGNN